MRVGFDVSSLHVPHSRGLARVVGSVVPLLERRGRLEVVRLAPPAGARLRRWRQLELPRAARREGLDGIHSFTSAFPLRGPGRRVQTLHELPWKHGVAENADLAHRLWAALGPLRAARVLTASEFSARDIRARWLPGAYKLRVIPWGVGAPFQPEPPPGGVDETVLARYRLGEDPLVLCLGGAREKKNLAALLRGLAELRRSEQPHLQVVVSGADGPQLRRNLGLASQLGLARHVLTLEEIDERDLPALLRLSTLVPLLSASEGFGLPVLEAMACGTPVLVPRDSAQSELAGELGIACDPADPASVALGLREALARREELRQRLPGRARQFSWERCAAAIEDVWLELGA